MSDPLTSDEPDDYSTRTTSPDGTLVWLVSPAEWAASQWAMAGELWRKDLPTKLFSPPSDWSFEGREWVSPHTLRLNGRRFPGAMPGITLTLDADALAGTIEVDLDEKRVRATRIPHAPSGSQSFVVLLTWLGAYPKR